MSDRNIFPKWTNQLPTIIAVGTALIAVTVIGVFWYWLTPKHLNVGYQPVQPIPYSHKLHAGELGMDCRYCHFNVETSPQASIPPTQVCMNCHTTIKADSPLIQKLAESYDTNTPIEWVKVHQLPDYAYFDHSRHVNSGIGCVSCHGRVDTMEVVRQVEPLSMAWCLECHRDVESNVRPKDKITDMGYHSSNQKVEGEFLKRLYKLAPREDCTTCHR
jgi:hypothetical protein